MENFSLYTHKLKQVYQNTGLIMPISASYEITTLCNLLCEHCYNKDKRTLEQEHLTLNEKKEIVYKLKELGVLEVIICGGEPFLDKDIFSIIELIKFVDIRLTILTNGIILTVETIKNLEKLMNDYDYIQVSIDDLLKGGTSRQRDLKENQQDALINCIKQLVKSDINFVVNITPTLLNQNNLIELIHQLIDMGIKNISITPYVPMGGEKADDIKPDYKMLARIEETIMGYTGDKGVNYSRGIDGHICQSMMEIEDTYNTSLNYKLMLRECDAAKFNIHISEYGKIYPCVFMEDENFLIGSIFEPIEKIKKNLKGIFEKINIKLPDKCISCDILQECGGGCSGLIFNRYKKLDEVDPRCRR